MIAPFGIRPKGTLAARMLPLARELVRRGHRMTIIAPPVHNPQDAGRDETIDGVLVRHTAPQPVNAATHTFALLRAALAAPADVLHLFKPKGYGGLAVLAHRALRPRVPLVVDTDDWEGPGGWNDALRYPPLAKALFAWQERDLPRRAAAVTVVSRALAAQVRANGAAADRIFYLPNGGFTQDIPAHPLRTRATRLLLYTRFWEFALDELVIALTVIAARCPDARLIVVGRGERGEHEALPRLLAEAGLTAMLDMRGWLEPAQIPAVFAEADIALVPMADTLINRARGLAKLLELMSYGLPIVASRVGQAAEYLTHETSGLLVPPGDDAALAASTLRLIEDDGLRARLGAGAQAAARAYAWERLAATAEAAYTRALQEMAR